MQTTTSGPEFLSLLASLEREYGSKQEVAGRIGITPSRYSRVRKGNAYGLSTENCLRLAKLSGLPPHRVLVSCGKPDVAELLASLYVTAAEQLSGVEFRMVSDPNEMAWLELWRDCPVESRATLRGVAALIARPVPGGERAGSRQRSARKIPETTRRAHGTR